MKNTNSFKLGLVVSLTLGLSACNMDSPFGGSDETSERMMTTRSSTMPQNNNPAPTTTKTASKAAEPVQPSTPGPKRTAAPQIPVIQ